MEGDKGEEVETEEEMDEEGLWFLCRCLGKMCLFAWTAAAKHAAFVRARGRHYSNEAEAMKVSNWRCWDCFENMLKLS
jgi:protein phosphatase inhibitor 2